MSGGVGVGEDDDGFVGAGGKGDEVQGEAVEHLDVGRGAVVGGQEVCQMGGVGGEGGWGEQEDAGLGGGFGGEGGTGVVENG